MSAVINGTQVDFEAAILTQFGRQFYKHYYTVRETAAGSDINDQYANLTITTCDPNPCENSGTCSLGFAGSFYCVCPKFFIGTFYILN